MNREEFNNLSEEERKTYLDLARGRDNERQVKYRNEFNRIQERLGERVDTLYWEKKIPRCFGKMDSVPGDIITKYNFLETELNFYGGFEMSMGTSDHALEKKIQSVEKAEEGLIKNHTDFLECVTCKRDIFLRCAVVSEMRIRQEIAEY